MLRILQITIASLALFSAVLLSAQDDVSLGEAAREARKAKPAEAPAQEPKVIDNDNFALMMDEAEAARITGKPVFSIDSSGKTFRMTSPDGTCSLSFDAKATALISTPYVASDLPYDELLKLEGPATIHDDALEVSLHNGTGWEIREVVVGITVLQQPAMPGFLAKAEPEGNANAPEKRPDQTILYHLKGTAIPDSTATFRATLAGDFNNSHDWHWAIVSARGVPPVAPAPQPAEAVMPSQPDAAGSPHLIEASPVSRPGASSNPPAASTSPTPH
jgi:hypothetical protein